MNFIYFRQVIKGILILLFFFSAEQFNPAYSRVGETETISVHSAILNEGLGVTVILPADYDSSTCRYPSVYLLHGFGGDHGSWINRCRIENIIDSLQLTDKLQDCIYILPDGRNSYYINNFDSSYRYMDFFIGELVPLIDAKYRTCNDQAKRAVMGMSMGGFGSVILSVKHPEIFGISISLSGALRNENQFLSLSDYSYDKFFLKVFGPRSAEPSGTSQHWKENSPYCLIDSLSAKELGEVKWYIDCGLDDSLLPANEAFHELLMRYKIPHEYHVRPGSHSWEYWKYSTIQSLNYLNSKLPDVH
ncbi:MAG: hypothetical protein JW801_15410 [Bacteroidales bacterium]|nr:hypothetical protein [Bacteroidales bacterium]